MITIEDVLIAVQEYFDQAVFTRNTYYQYPMGSKLDAVRAANMLRRNNYQVEICSHDFFYSLIISIKDEVMLNEIHSYAQEAINYFNQKHHCSIFKLVVYEKATGTRVANLLRSGGYIVNFDTSAYLPTLIISQSKNLIPKK